VRAGEKHPSLAAPPTYSRKDATRLGFSSVERKGAARKKGMLKGKEQSAKDSYLLNQVDNKGRTANQKLGESQGPRSGIQRQDKVVKDKKYRPLD